MKILAVDISSVFRRAWEAGHDDAFTVARSRAVSKVLDAASGVDRIVIARDPPYTLPDGTRCASFRRALLDGYKADRVDPGEAYREQLRGTVEELRGRGALSFVSPRMAMPTERDGWAFFGEADDVLASLAMWFQEKRGEEWSLRILTGDTDLWALVDDELMIDVVDLDGKTIMVDAVVERFGVAPPLVPEVKALCGDKSDGYKTFEHPERDAKNNVKAGIGPALAAKIVLSSVEREPGERSGADGVIRAVLTATDPGCDLNAPSILCLKHHGHDGLLLGRQLAYMRPDLQIDFSTVLDEPRRKPIKTTAPDVQVDAAPPDARSAPAAPSTALAVAQSAALAPPARHSLEPVDMGQAMDLAKWMDGSNLFRKNLPSPAACLMVIGIARSIGMPVFLAAQHAFMVQGRLGWSAQFQMALVQSHPTTRRFAFVNDKCNDRAAAIAFERSGPHSVKGVYPFTIEDAQKAGFLDGKHSGQWRSRPSIMLRWAAARECARLHWGDILWGMHAPDEIEHGGMVDNPGEFPSGMVVEEA